MSRRIHYDHSHPAPPRLRLETAFVAEEMEEATEDRIGRNYYSMDIVTKVLPSILARKTNACKQTLRTATQHGDTYTYTQRVRI